MWLFQNNHITIAILVAAFHWWHDNFFVNGRAKHWRRRIWRAYRQLISSIKSSSTQCQSNTRLYSVECENISTWKKFNRKVNTWNASGTPQLWYGHISMVMHPRNLLWPHIFDKFSNDCKLFSFFDVVSQDAYTLYFNLFTKVLFYFFVSIFNICFKT